MTLLKLKVQISKYNLNIVLIISNMRNKDMFGGVWGRDGGVVGLLGRMEFGG